MSTRLEIPDWTGSTLTAGAFSEYVGRGNRVADKGGDTTASLCKAVTGFLVDAYRQVNAVARINPGGSAELAIREVNGYIAHYKDIAAQPSKRSGKDEPTPEPDEEVPAS